MVKSSNDGTTLSEHVSKTYALLSDGTCENEGQNVSFYFGDKTQSMCAVAEKVCPHGRPAVFYSKQSFENNGKEYARNLKGRDFKIVNVILPKECADVKSLCKLFSLPEDVRLVIAADGEVYDAALYYCKANALPCVLIVNRPEDVCSALKKYLSVKNGDATDNVILDCSRYVLADENELYTQNFSSVYAYNMGMFTLLTDYRIYCAAKRVKPEENVYNLIKHTVSDTFKTMSYGEEDRKVALLKNAFDCALAALYCKTDIYGISALFTAQRLAESKTVGTSLCLALALASLCAEAFSGKYEHLPDAPDYGARALFLADRLNGTETQYLENFKEQTDLKECSVKVLKSLCAEVGKENGAFCSFAGVIKNTFTVLGGKYDGVLPETAALKYSGDGLKAFNSMTVIREKGVTEIESFD